MNWEQIVWGFSRTSIKYIPETNTCCKENSVEVSNINLSSKETLLSTYSILWRHKNNLPLLQPRKTMQKEEHLYQVKVPPIASQMHLLNCPVSKWHNIRLREHCNEATAVTSVLPADEGMTFT